MFYEQKKKSIINKILCLVDWWNLNIYIYYLRIIKNLNIILIVRIKSMYILLH